MRSFIGLTVCACVGMLATAGVGKAQVVSFTATDYNGAANPPTIAPLGQFSAPATKLGGQYRVAVDYGTLSGGAFISYPANTAGIPNLDTTVAQNVGAGGGTFNWIMGINNCPGITIASQARAQLQVSTDGGTTWANTGGPSLFKAIP